MLPTILDLFEQLLGVLLAIYLTLLMICLLSAGLTLVVGLIHKPTAAKYCLPIFEAISDVLIFKLYEHE